MRAEAPSCRGIVQGRAYGDWGWKTGSAVRDGLSPPVSRSGTGVRILGEVKKDYADLLRRADILYRRRCAGRIYMTRPAKPLRCFCRSSRWGDGRRPPLRLRRSPCARSRRWISRPPAGRICLTTFWIKGVAADHQRGARHFSGGLRCVWQAAGHYRVGGGSVPMWCFPLITGESRTWMAAFVGFQVEVCRIWMDADEPHYGA